MVSSVKPFPAPSFEIATSFIVNVTALALFFYDHGVKTTEEEGFFHLIIGKKGSDVKRRHIPSSGESLCISLRSEDTSGCFVNCFEHAIEVIMPGVNVTIPLSLLTIENILQAKRRISFQGA